MGLQVEVDSAVPGLGFRVPLTVLSIKLLHEYYGAVINPSFFCGNCHCPEPMPEALIHDLFTFLARYMVAPFLMPLGFGDGV